MQKLCTNQCRNNAGATFDRRRTRIPDQTPIVLSEEFSLDTGKITPILRVLSIHLAQKSIFAHFCSEALAIDSQILCRLAYPGRMGLSGSAISEHKSYNHARYCIGHSVLTHRPTSRAQRYRGGSRPQACPAEIRSESDW